VRGTDPGGYRSYVKAVLMRDAERAFTDPCE
jgi:hypothetical protein